MLPASPAVNHPFLREISDEKRFFLYHLTPSTQPHKLWDKRPVYDGGDSANLLYAWEAEQRQAAWGTGYCLGYHFAPDSGRFFYDIDGCRNPVTGELTEKAHEAIALFRVAGAYMEVSVSGTGVHIVGKYRGARPVHGCKNEALGLELYTGGRGMAIGTPYEGNGSPNADCTEMLQYVIACYFPPSPATEGPAGWSEGHELGWVLPDDAELIRRAMSFNGAGSAFGSKASFADLWTANEAALAVNYPDVNGRAYDASSGDFALAGRLAWLTGNDCPRIERLMRQSALVRDKWDRKDYLCERTILRALVKDGEFYDPKYRESQASALSTVPSAPTPGGIAMTPEERMLANLATQHAVALIFAQRMKGRMLFDRSAKLWMEFDGIRWAEDRLGRVHYFILNIASEMNTQNKAAMVSASFCDGVNRHLQTFPEFSRNAEQFDRDNYLLNTPAGTTTSARVSWRTIIQRT